jgi:hypothetical protein
LIGIRNRLDSKSDERDDANFSAPLIHLCDAPAAQVFDLALNFRPTERSVTRLIRSAE